MKTIEAPHDVKWHQANDGLIGERVVVQCRKIGSNEVVNLSGRHKASQLIAKDNVRAWIELPRRVAKP